MNEGFVNEFMWNRLNSGSWRKKYILITHLKHFYLENSFNFEFNFSWKIYILNFIVI